ncbi:low-density lipoprotein receptor-related protein 12-like [Plectropomus leopardus]|uniref:low-density lipoprotein receptor-related protein 12-like n=1 Tax=Plectropomus leopardus TaxID=160734 RepID=UPI001C4BD67E|nr:low-density lipoprotein receptor-related protein 12-like [Plectropomus leopardus]
MRPAGPLVASPRFSSSTVTLLSLCPQASVLENLRLAVRSQLGFTSLRLPSSGRHSNLWRRLFTFSRSRRSGSLALVSADLEDSAGTGSTGSSGSDLLSPDSDDTDTEGERGRERGLGAVGGPVAPLPQKTPPSTAVEAVVSVTTSSTSVTLPPGHDGDSPREAPPPSGPVAVVTSSPDPNCQSDTSELQAPPTSALQRLAQNLHRLARNLTRTGQNQQNNAWTNHSPLHQLETGRGGAEEQRGNREEEEDVELLIPVSDSDSASSLISDIRQPLLEPHLSAGHAPHHHRGNVGRGGRDGPCEHCGMVHTAQIPDACLEAGGGKTESSDDELLLLC